MHNEQTVICNSAQRLAIIGQITTQSNCRFGWRANWRCRAIEGSRTMPSVQGYRLERQVAKQQRPLGVAILATIGVLGSLVALAVALVRLLALLGGRPSLQL